MKQNNYKYNVTVNHSIRELVLPYADKRHMLLGFDYQCRFEGIMHVGLLVNGIRIDPTDDDTFRYAAVEAADHGFVWCEESHDFRDPSWISRLRSGCFDTDNPEDAAQFWAEAVENVRKDINGEKPVTGEDDVAIVRDEDLAKACEESGLSVLPCGDQTILEDGTPNEWWEVRTFEGEDAYWDEIYLPEDNTEDEYEYDEEDFDPESDVETPIPWDESPETGELCFYGSRIHAFWDLYDSEGSIFLGSPSRKYGGFKITGSVSGIQSKDALEGIIRKVLYAPDDITIEDDVLKHRLEEIPFDRWDESSWCFYHATGWEYFDISTNTWWDEYEDDLR